MRYAHPGIAHDRFIMALITTILSYARCNHCRLNDVRRSPSPLYYGPWFPHRKALDCDETTPLTALLEKGHTRERNFRISLGRHALSNLVVENTASFYRLQH
ncbi:hypothetical protein Y032_0009g582 [Ancylostoma ceylanicum]|uniref:Uncharacterized protein n=1 Tax=Ancylostoma ceylanicum TaxID=53326 RepID=A0A016VJK5_9BILA|nr:hypothetical protein Y032_0009g582 [Ancylostoma ceylanicum]